MDARADNRALNDREFAGGALVARSRPLEYTVGLTRRCNYACKMCYRETADFPLTTEMSPEMLGKIAPHLAVAEKTSWHGDGELFAARDFARFFDVIASCPAPQNGFITNGYRLEEHASAIVESRITFVDVSLDAATPRTYALVRNSERAFEKVCRGIRTIADLRRGGQPRLTIRFLAMSVNIHELPDLVRLAAHLGADSVVVMRVVSAVLAPAVRHWVVDPAEEKRHCVQARKIASELGIHLEHSHDPEILRDPVPDLPLRPAHRDGGAPSASPTRAHGAGNSTASNDRCRLPWSSMYVLPDGSVRACCHQTRPLGDLGSQSYDDIWNGSSYRSLREAMNEGDYETWCLPSCPRAVEGRLRSARNPDRPFIAPAKNGRRQVLSGAYEREEWPEIGPVFWTDGELLGYLRPRGTEATFRLDFFSGLRSHPLTPCPVCVQLHDDDSSLPLLEFELACQPATWQIAERPLPSLHGVERIRVTVRTETFRPNQLYESPDCRELGIAIREIALE